MGEWGAMVREIEDGITMVEKNGDAYRAQTLRLYRAWLHLHAMDFAGVLAICEAVLPLFGALAWSAWRRFCLVLAGTAATALGHVARAWHSLMIVQEDMERQRVIHDWYCRMLLEAALTDLWLARGDLAQARSQAGNAFSTQHWRRRSAPGRRWPGTPRPASPSRQATWRMRTRAWRRRW